MFSELFEIYSSCKDSQQVVAAQNKYLADMEETYLSRRRDQSSDLMSRNQNHLDDMMPPSESENEEDSSDDVEDLTVKLDKLGNIIR